VFSSVWCDDGGNAGCSDDECVSSSTNDTSLLQRSSDVNKILVESTGDTYVKAPKNTNKCPSRSKTIETKEGCQKAAEALDLKLNPKSDSWNQMPGGCFQKGEWLFFNEHEGKGTDKASKVCKKFG